MTVKFPRSHEGLSAMFYLQSFIGPGETDIVSPVYRAGRGWPGADGDR